MIEITEAEVQSAVKAMRSVAPWDSGRETIWQFQARQARAALEAAYTKGEGDEDR